MYDNYNYPAGADTPQAPWNQQQQRPRTFAVEAFCTMHTKGDTIETDQYTRPNAPEDPAPSIEDVDLEPEWRQQHHSLGDILHMFCLIAQEYIDNVGEQQLPPRHPRARTARVLSEMVADAALWHEDEKQFYVMPA